MRPREYSETLRHSSSTFASSPSLARSVLLHSICLPFCTLTAAVTSRRPRLRAALLLPPPRGAIAAGRHAAGRSGALAPAPARRWLPAALQLTAESCEAAASMVLLVRKGVGEG